MKFTNLSVVIVASVAGLASLAGLAILAVAATGSAGASDDPAAGVPSPNHVFELPQSAGRGEGRAVSVLLDTPTLKLATVVLRDGTALPSHRAKVPATILVLEGEGVIHLGDEAVPVSSGTLVALAGNEEHDVVPRAGSDMILLVHYLRITDGSDHSD